MACRDFCAYMVQFGGVPTGKNAGSHKKRLIYESSKS